MQNGCYSSRLRINIQGTKKIAKSVYLISTHDEIKAFQNAPAPADFPFDQDEAT